MLYNHKREKYELGRKNTVQESLLVEQVINKGNNNQDSTKSIPT